MPSTGLRLLSLLLLSLLVAPPLAAKPSPSAQVTKCQALKDRVERYTVQRRRGGSASQMQQWKDQLRAAEEQFSRLECRDVRRKLR